jgi:type II secretory pathway predicted ATPase ExeA
LDDQSDQPLVEDLSFLDDLDRGLELDPGLDRATPHHAARDSVSPPAQSRSRSLLIDDRELRPDRHDRLLSRRRRPLLDLFPSDRVEDAAPPASSGPWVPATRRPVPSARPRLQPVATGGRPTYEIFYGLNEKPFSLSSDPRFLYHSTAHDRAAHEILAALERRDGVVTLTGAAGSGKTTLCRLVIDELDTRTFTALVLDSFVTIEGLLKKVLIDFGVISHAEVAAGRLSSASRSELTIALKEFLLSLVPLGAFAVVFVDDAHNLSGEMLEQVRGLSVPENDGQLIQLVLVGERSLLTRLGRPNMHQVDQRMTVDCDLGPLTEDEIAGYVLHRLVVSGDGPSRVEFGSDALTRIHEFSRGVPRLVNRICDRALTLGYEQSASVIDAALVEAAAHDLDLIPPEATSARARRLGTSAAALVGLMLVGAIAATLVFRTKVERVITAWQAIPSLPPPPLPRMVRPVDHVAVPIDGLPDGDASTPSRR